jgi:hypothetical protein
MYRRFTKLTIVISFFYLEVILSEVYTISISKKVGKSNKVRLKFF